jgi:predicted AlkP superfamily phosphohydrolase/phosphomutase
MKRRVLMVGLDGYDPAVGERLMAEGELPALESFARRSARFALDHGAAKRTGLAWEHVSTGRSPEGANRWAAVHLDSQKYSVWQEPTALPPFPAALHARTVVFDPPYFDMDRAPGVQGVVAWGAHDPGVEAAARPAALSEELRERFGSYPAKPWIYGFVWPSVRKTAAMGEALARAVDVRAAAATWLLSERLPDWDLGYVVVSELHSGSEALWHGMDASHPLHGLPSAAPAGEGIKSVYRAVDRLVGKLAGAFPDATVVVFNLHGMGTNNSDVPGMALLPELLMRDALGKGLLTVPPEWVQGLGVPILAEEQAWRQVVGRMLPDSRRRGGRLSNAWRRRPSWLGGRRPRGRVRTATGTEGKSLEWMPAARYREHWAVMPAFALPSLYDGRVRINLAGREARGTVQPGEYDAACDAVERLIRECSDPRTGESVVAAVERPAAGDPRTLGATEGDLVVLWRGSPLAFAHPRLGMIGPLPYRRTGGHTGGLGMAYVSGQGVTAADHGVRSAFDVVPTVVELLGETVPEWMSGTSFAPLLETQVTTPA